MRLDRLSWILILLGAVWIVLLCRTFQVQVWENDKYEAVANRMAQDRVIQKALRGRILDRNGIVLAQSIQEKILYKKDSTVDARIETRRVFPQGSLASQILGQVGRDGMGLYGMEKRFEERLRGTDGWHQRVKNKKGEIQAGRKLGGVDPIPGEDLVLTIDRNIQEIVESALKEGVETFEAKSASALVVDPHTGEVLAMASYPTFDPNGRNMAESRFNRSDIVSLVFEPGSTFKLVTAATAVETGAVNPKTVFSGEGGRWRLENGEVIRDTKDHGDMNMTQAMTMSSNIVFAKIADQIGNKEFFRSVRAFGFGSKTGIELGEESGMLKPIEKWSGRTLKTMGFGHEISVTPLQMTMAFCVIANGGTLVKPTLVKEWRNFEGEVVTKNSVPNVIRKDVVSKQTASKIRSMLRDVVAEGTAKQVNSSKLPGVVFGGKTGTAEKYSQELKRYDRSKQVASFIGLSPAENTRYVCMVLVDDPKTKTVGGLTAGPIFRKIMEKIYYRPSTSPLPYNLTTVAEKKICDADFTGLSKTGAKVLADSLGCAVSFEGSGELVVAADRNFETDGFVLRLGSANSQTMPDLKGLPLREALEQIGRLNGSVEYEGVGRVQKQSPAPNAAIRRGEKFKLVLSERG